MRRRRRKRRRLLNRDGPTKAYRRELRQLQPALASSFASSSRTNIKPCEARAAAGVPPEGRTDAREAECTPLVALSARRVQRLEADCINGTCIVTQHPRVLHRHAGPEGNALRLD